MTPSRLALIALVPAALGLSACAYDNAPTAAASAPGPRAARQCLFAKSITGFQALGDQAVNVRVGVSEVYHLELLLPCRDLPFSLGVGLRTNAGSDVVCSPLDAELVVGGPTGSQRCPLTSIQKLTPGEVAALAPNQRP